MSKITLSNVQDITQSTTAQAVINNNSTIVQTAFDNTLSRDGTSPNQMISDLDMNSNQILNLPTPSSPNSPVRFVDLTTLQAGGTVNTLPTGGTTGQSLQKTSSTNYAVNWENTVNSVALSLPSDFSVSGSPVNTTTGTLTASWTSVPTGTGSIVRATAPTITNAVLTSPSLSGVTAINNVTITQPSSAATLTIANGKTLTANNTLILAGTDGTTITFQGTDTYVSRTSTDTLTNKTLTSPVIGTIVNTGTLTLPTATDTLTGRATTDTLTNKTFDTAGTGNVFKINGTQITANTGTGSNVLATAPTFSTNLTSPIIIGGTGASSTLSLQSTSGAGTGSEKIVFLAGNNGASQAGVVQNSSAFNGSIGSANYSAAFGMICFGTQNGASTTGYMGLTSEDQTGGVNYRFSAGANGPSFFNAPSGNSVIFRIANANQMTVDATNGVLSVLGLRSQSSSIGVGYATGAGGTVTQGTSRTTGVTLNTNSGAITLVSATGSTTPASFTLTNSSIAATDIVHVTQKSGTDKYEIFVTNTAAGSCQITSFTTGGTTTEQPVFNFAIIKGVTS